jgi:hypothetical protein
MSPFGTCCPLHCTHCTQFLFFSDQTKIPFLKQKSLIGRRHRHQNSLSRHQGFLSTSNHPPSTEVAAEESPMMASSSKPTTMTSVQHQAVAAATTTNGMLKQNYEKKSSVGNMKLESAIRCKQGKNCLVTRTHVPSGGGGIRETRSFIFMLAESCVIFSMTWINIAKMFLKYRFFCFRVMIHDEHADEI